MNPLINWAVNVGEQVGVVGGGLVGGIPEATSMLQKGLAFN